MGFNITRITAREVLDCRGLPTVQADVWLDDRFLGRADVPSGRSTGANEAHELRDGDQRYGGFGVRRAIANIVDEIAPTLIGRQGRSQREIDGTLVELDGTPDKSRLGANAILAVSLATARAAALSAELPLYRYLNADAHVLPVPQVNLINGGKHASNDLDFQEFIVMPTGAQTFSEALRISSEINLRLRDLILEKYGKAAINVGDEGGCAPQISEPAEAFEILSQAVVETGYADKIRYALDCAATHFYDAAAELYTVAGEQLDRDGLIALYETLIRDWGVVSIEDPLEQEDFEGFTEITERLGIQIVGDDLFVTNPSRVQRGVDDGAANALLLKVNQIGTLSEALDAASIARSNGYAIVVSERSGETEDPIIADLVVALNAGQIKTGAPVRGERTSKYNALLLIEEELGSAAEYAGEIFQPISATPSV